MRTTRGQEGAILAFVTLLGLGVRLAIVVPAPFPLNDGGLFYTMISDLAANHMRLPDFTSYNAAAIPFAYPPLAFYVYALLTAFTQISPVTLMQYGPAIVSAASIPAFFWLATDILASRREAGLATVVFALIPRAFDWLIMGGGVTRSLGMVFGLLAMHQAFRVFAGRDRRATIPLTVLASLVVMTHPEASVHTAITAVFFFLWQDRTGKGLLAGAAVAVGAVVLTSPWWGTVLATHGPGPFLAVFAAARVDSPGLVGTVLSFLRLDIADEPFIALLTVVGLVGIAYAASRHDYGLPAWMLAMYLLEPRGAPTFVMIPLAMAAGIGLDRVLLPALHQPNSSSEDGVPGIPVSPTADILRQPPTRLFVTFLVLFSTVSAYSVGWRIRQQLTLTEADLAAFSWVRENTAGGSRFALVTRQLPLRDAISEWFPAETGRASAATVFGYEWSTNTNFGWTIERYRDLQACADQSAECLQQWQAKNGAQIDYILISDASNVGKVALFRELTMTPTYVPVYRSKSVAIFAVR